MDLMILGASARAAAISAIRLGLRPTTADLFADADLAAACPSNRIAPGDYPEGLSRFADGLESTPWLYTGALENRPRLIDRIAKRHRLLGNVGATLRGVRNPLAVADVVREAGLKAPRIRADPTDLPTDGSWLLKPRASGGGRGIRPWSGGLLADAKALYCQERIDGLSLAGLFLGHGTGAQILGISRQFVGRPGNRFAYRGSLGPWPVPGGVSEQAERLGQVIASAFKLVGLFGIDLIFRGNILWPIEVNPRYTASVEVLEWASGRSLLAKHLLAFGWDAHEGEIRGSDLGYVGKTIIHADRSFSWTGADVSARPDFDRCPDIADIPRPGTYFQPGDPVLTVFARGDTPEECRRNLGQRIREWRARLRSSSR